MATPADAADDQRVLVFTPTGKDARLTTEVLHGAGIPALVCDSLDIVAREFESGAAALIVAEEALSPDVLAGVTRLLAAQPTWSDPPVIVLLLAGTPHEAATLRFGGCFGNATFLARPVGISSLLTAVRTALRGRQRQYEMRTLMSELQRAMRAREAFVAAVSHELRTPLNVILGRITLLRRAADQPERRDALVDTIDRNARILWHLVEDLIEIARAGSGRFQLQFAEVDLASLVQSAVEGLRQAADAKGVTMTAGVEPLPVVRGDAVRLQQVVSNLVWNAVKFTPTGGRIDVSASVVRGAVEMSVCDTGIGIPPEFLPHIFEPFRQGTAPPTDGHRGLGLGLSIVRHLVEAHGGTIVAASDGVGRGSRFTLRLPLVATAEHTSPQ